ADGWCNEITWNEACTLMNQLIKRMLPIGARLAPYDRTRGIGDSPARTVDRLAVALHIALLEISRKSMQILVIRQNSFRFRTKKIAVPYPYQSHNHGDIAFQRL